MVRFLRGSLIAVVALAIVLTLMPAPAAAARWGGRGFYGGGFYARGWYGPGWGWGYPGWYGPGWGYYGVPYDGTVKIVTHDKDASVYVDGGFAGVIADTKKFSLPPGTHELALRAPNGQTLSDQRVEVLRGKTTQVHVD